MTGKLTDADSGAVIAGATVGIRGHDSGFTGDLAATTNATGNFTINNVPQNHSYVLETAKAGYLPIDSNVSVGTGTATANGQLTRDWSASSGGAQVTSSTAPDYSAFGCGPAGAIDLSQGSGWGSNSPSNTTDGSGQGQTIPTGSRSIVIHLPQKVDIREFQIDPGATCGDDDTAGVSQFTVATRTSSAAAWTTAWNYTGSGLTEHAFTAFPPTTGKQGVTDVKLTMNNNRGNANYMDMSELLVFGKPAATTVTHTLTVSKAGGGAGTVTSSPSGISCGSTCSHAYAAGTAVTLTAPAASGSTFTGWSGAGCSGTGTCTVTMSANASVTATFTKNSTPPSGTHTLTVSKAGGGAGTVTSSPSGISCGSTCSHSYAAGTAVTLTATAASGSTFTGWSGGGCSGTGTCTVTMSTDEAATATFDEKSNPTPAPNTQIDKVKVKKKKAKISFSGSGGSGKLSFKCKLDRAGYKPCSSPKTYKRLKKGKHTVHVEAVDAAGTADPTPAQARFKVKAAKKKHKHHHKEAPHRHHRR